MSAKLRWGLLGAGAVSRQFARSVAQLPDHEVVAVASRSSASARSLAQDLGVPTAHTGYRSLVEDPAVDIVYVATPPSLHREHALLALEAGRPVLCEKPLAACARDAAAIAEAARRAGVFCMEAMWMRFIPAIRALKAKVLAGDLGQVRMLHAELGFAIPFSETSRYYAPELGGGALLDLGVYPLSLAYYLLGRPAEGRAVLSRAPTGVDDQAVIALSFASGALASLSCSFAQRARNSAVVVGDHGTITLPDPFYAPGVLYQTRHTAPPAGSSDADGARSVGSLVDAIPALVTARRTLAPVARRIVRREGVPLPMPFLGFGYQFEAAEAARCVRAGLCESPDMPLAESVEILAAIDALRSCGTL